MLKVIIVAGERGEGKTSFLKKTVEALQHKKRHLYGFYAKRVFDAAGKEGYKIVNVSTTKPVLLCKRDKLKTGTFKIQDFWFDESVIRLGEQWIQSGFDDEEPIFIVDEVGKFELDGFVWNGILSKILNLNKGVLLMTVRNKFVTAVINKYNLNAYTLKQTRKLLFTVEFVDEIERG